MVIAKINVLLELFFVVIVVYMYLVNERDISASKKRGSGWDRSRVRGYFKKKSKRVIYFNAISMLFENYTSTHTCA